MNKSLNILVTAIGGGGHGEQILKALRHAKDNRYNLFGADSNSNCPQFALVEKGFVVPRADSPDFLSAVLSICKKYSINALFHGCETELQKYSDNRNLFYSEDIFLPINTKNTIAKCMDKLETASFLKEIGIPGPQSALIENYEQAEKLNFFPMILKPNKGSGGSKDCYIVQNAHQMRAILLYLQISSDNPILAQEYVGSSEKEYTVGVLHDMDGNYINAISIRRELKSGLNIKLSVKNQLNREDLGPHLIVSSGISMGLVERNEEVIDTCKKIAWRLDARGAINIQGRLTSEGFKVFEINPRFSGTTSIRALMGYNEPDILLKKHLMKEEVRQDFPYKEGLVLRTLSEEIVDNGNFLEQWPSKS